MNTVIDSDVLMIGHVSRDRLVVNGHAASFTGGAVHYGSIPLRCIGLKTAVVTRLHSTDFDLLADMERAGPFSGTLTDVEQKVTALKRTDHT
jgi:hypothetical protein